LLRIKAACNKRLGNEFSWKVKQLFPKQYQNEKIHISVRAGLIEDISGFRKKGLTPLCVSFTSGGLNSTPTNAKTIYLSVGFLYFARPSRFHSLRSRIFDRDTHLTRISPERSTGDAFTTNFDLCGTRCLPASDRGRLLAAPDLAWNVPIASHRSMR
jgi:hypothetical protein